MKLTKRQIATFQHKIFLWWKTHRRDLPWRHTRDPYKILVSEVMLQQTQVSRVLPKYREFIKRYPTVKLLAQAGPADVLRIWKGMGYNRRALYLQKAAKEVVERHRGEFSKDEQLLRKLPGLGTYTARAVLVFAYKQYVQLVDTNIRKIITHFFFNDEPQKPSIIEEVARQLLPEGKSWEWHQALMDYGALEMQAKQSRVKNQNEKIPFKESNRFYRGRIIDRLRDGSMNEKKLLKELGITYKKHQQFFSVIVSSLEHDGLITRSRAGIISLPE